VLKEIQSIAGSQVVFGILFIALAWLVLVQVKNMLREQRDIENKREDQIIEMYKERERDLKDLIAQTRQQGVELLTEQRLDSVNREKELLRQIERINESQKDISDTLKYLNDKIDRNNSDLWRVIGGNGQNLNK
jgi:vacuolar-type H+-ATPase subunit I/STV1